jgi:cytochrome c oxidase cbb3-type subunit 2
MPGFPWLSENKLDGADTAKKMQVMNTLISSTCNGCQTYSDEQIANAADAVKGKTEMDALIAYLQGLGTSIKTRR